MHFTIFQLHTFVELVFHFIGIPGFRRWSLKGLLTDRSMGWSWSVQLIGTSTGWRCFLLSKVVISSLKSIKDHDSWMICQQLQSFSDSSDIGTMMLLISLIVVSGFAQWFGVCQMLKSVEMCICWVASLCFSCVKDLHGQHFTCHCYHNCNSDLLLVTKANYWNGLATFFLHSPRWCWTMLTPVWSQLMTSWGGTFFSWASLTIWLKYFCFMWILHPKGWS